MAKNKKNKEIINEELASELVEEINIEEELRKEIEDLKEENEKLKEEAIKLKNDYLKAYADTENIQRRIKNEFETLKKYRIQQFALDVLPVIDNLERALSHETSDENYRKGVEMIYSQLITSLKNEGLSVIETKDKDFDPNFHQAVTIQEVEDVEPNKIVEEFQKGYMLKDRLLRPSMVMVSK